MLKIQLVPYCQLNIGTNCLFLSEFTPTQIVTNATLSLQRDAGRISKTSSGNMKYVFIL